MVGQMPGVCGRTWPNGRVHLRVGDITQERVDVVVNAANPTLMGGGGVDGAVHRAAGPAVLRECQRLRRIKYPDGLPAGDAVVTNAGRLHAKRIIHTVGPIYRVAEGDAPKELRSCYLRALTLAREQNMRTIAFPAISTGVYGYPPSAAAVVVSLALTDFLPNLPSITEVRLVFFTDEDASIFLAHQAFPTL